MPDFIKIYESVSNPVHPRPKLLVALLLALPLSSALRAQADELGLNAHRYAGDVVTLATTGPSGALTVPDGRVLADGTTVIGINNAMETQFSHLQRGVNYQFGIGFLPNVELSGRITNYPNQQGALGLRDLSANIKIGLPKIFKSQPDIAVGINDLGGGAPYLKSKYLAVSETFGPLRVNVGLSRGEPYIGKAFGSAELALWNTGVSVLAERNSQSYLAGLRFVSSPIKQLGNGRIVASLQRSFKTYAADGSSFNRSNAGLFFVAPFGEKADKPRKVAALDEPIWTPPLKRGLDKEWTGGEAASVREPLWTPSGGANVQAAQPIPAISDVSQLGALTVAAVPALGQIRDQIIKAGLERVRVGLRGQELVVEYENHRYNQNEVDAIGIVLGVASVLAGDRVGSVTAVTKKSGLALYQTTVDRRTYHAFLRDGEVYEARSALSVRYRPDSAGTVQWLDQVEGPRGYSRIRIDPQLIKFVATEVGVFDYSLSANIQAFVPLWMGAELSTSYIRTLGESDDVKHGFLGYAQQPSKLKSALVSQSLWLTDRVLNVTSAGKFLYDAKGIQNELTWFTPYRDDQVRLQASRMTRIDFYGLRQEIRAGSLSYLWSYQPLGITAEVAYNRYRTRDKGPSLQFSRWFGDVQAQAYLRTSGTEKKVGFSMAFPLTPRQGARPGWTHLEGASSFPFKLETRLASKGECNCITNSVVEELPMVYSARGNLLNHARTGKDYFISQLQRMREAALVYASVVP